MNEKTCLVLVSKIFPQAQVYWVTCDEQINWSEFQSFLVDQVDTELWINPAKEWKRVTQNSVTYVGLKSGVTDNPASAFHDLLKLHPRLKERSFKVHSGVITWGEGRCYQNPLIHDIKRLPVGSALMNGLAACRTTALEVKTFPLSNLTDEQLDRLSKDNFWALSIDEMKAIRAHFSQDPTDVEMEVLAQTWSEHCKHKIFNAFIEYEDANGSFSVDGIYDTYIKGATRKLAKPWAVSVFKDNAGVVDWDENLYVCIKVETHNSPSALDPYGGALTGILGVNRDIMGCGLGFKPIANTNVLCFGEWDENRPINGFPSKLLHPRKILKGVHKGIQDGGNKSGIPTVNGAVLFDENFSGKPLVFCGTVGVAPKKVGGFESHKKYQKTGDKIVMLGGRVGADGIHGATASSLAMDETTPNSMVQIGDPLTQKRMLDFIIKARDLALFTSITDNGAGGLSSSVGEMAVSTNGATIDLKAVPLKYPGLKPWQIMVSESQERMTLAVCPSKLEAFLELAGKMQVEATVLGEFTDSGFLEIRYGQEITGRLDLKFLHDGLPRLKLKAKWNGPTLKPSQNRTVARRGLQLQTMLQTIASDRSLASKEPLIRQYDHEVQAATIVKPSEGDAGVIWLGVHGKVPSNNAIAIASGVCPQYSHIDTEMMAKLAVDECVRNLLCHGVRPDRIALVDNFCWPDPLPGTRAPHAEHKLAQLVRASRGLYEICLDYQMPLISGKDSMKNDYYTEAKHADHTTKAPFFTISVPPTLLITGIGLIDELRHIRRSSIKKSGDLLYVIGPPVPEKYFGFELEKHFGMESSWTGFSYHFKDILKFYHQLHALITTDIICSAHDVSEGGLLFALFETLLKNRLGLRFSKECTRECQISDSFLFSETPGRFIVSVSPDKKEKFEAQLDRSLRIYLGEADSCFKISLISENIDLVDIEKAWRVSWE